MLSHGLIEDHAKKLYEVEITAKTESEKSRIEGRLYGAAQYPEDDIFFSEPEFMPGKTGAFTLINKNICRTKRIFFVSTVDVDLFATTDSNWLKDGRAWTGFLECGMSCLEGLINRIPELTITEDLSVINDLLTYYGNLGRGAGVSEISEHTMIFISDTANLAEVESAIPHFAQDFDIIDDDDLPAEPPQFARPQQSVKDEVDEIISLLRSAGAIIAENYCVFQGK